MDALKYRRFTVVAVMFALFAAQETRGTNAYLSQIGPSPLRFSLATAVPASFVLPLSLVERQAPTNTTEIASTATTSTQTNAAAASSTANPSPNSQPTVLSADSPPSPVPHPAASDMLPVSPQMLTEFFKPAAQGTNSADPANSVSPIVVPLPVGFTPPSAQPRSRATYTSP